MGALRLFLALSVVLWHIPGGNFHLMHGALAVVLFYVVSGFYMALVLNERYDRARDFYIARALRIYPTYWAACVFVLLCFALLRAPNVFTSAMGQGPLAHIVLLAMNLLLFGADLFRNVVNLLDLSPRPDWQAPALAIAAHFPKGFFSNPFMLIDPAWTLGCELLFYLAAPFIARSPRRIIFWFVASVSLRTLMIGGFGMPSFVWGYNFFPVALCFFLLGSAAYHLYRHIKNWRATPTIAYGFVTATSLAALIVIAQKGVILDYLGFDTPMLWCFYPAFALSLPFLFARWKDSRLDRVLGELSYPLYLVHGIIDAIFANVLHLPALAIPAALLVSAAIYFAIDRPVDRWRHKLSRRHHSRPHVWQQPLAQQSE